METVTSADVLIVGGGTAGCVLAARLSELPSLKVVLIEAGDDTPSDAVPPDIADLFPRAYANPAYFWPSLKAGTVEGTAPRAFSQARILGGGSSVMGMWALRGLAADYDRWAEDGALGWSYNDVLPFFKKLECDPQSSPAREQGPVTVRRVPREKWPGFNKALADAAEKLGLGFHPDPNTCDADGIFPIPISADHKMRASTATVYLTPAVRRRPNLHIITSAEVSTLVIDGRKVTGVQVRDSEGAVRIIGACRVVLAAGAIYSPALLLRSGVGSAKSLTDLGLPTVHDLPAVGRNLQNHVFFHIGALLQPRARQDPAVRNYAMAGARVSSGVKGAPSADLFLSFISRTGPRSTDNRIGLVGGHLYAPFSRGEVTLTPENPALPPTINFHMLDDARDRERLLYAADFARRLIEHEAVRPAILETFLLPADPPIRRLTAPGLGPAILSRGLAAVVAMNAGFRRAALNAGLGYGRLLNDMESHDRFHELVLESSTAMGHPVGTCAIGSVVDPSTKVKGMGGLYVADSSIMPLIPRANTNIPTIMVAERSVPLILHQ